MRIHSTPVPFTDPDYSNYDFAAEEKREQEHQEQVKLWLQQSGWTGPLTGQLLYEGVGDGHAQYMYADAPGAKACLIHLPYGDAYHSQNVGFLPKAEVIKRIKRDMSRPKLFACA